MDVHCMLMLQWRMGALLKPCNLLGGRDCAQNIEYC